LSDLKPALVDRYEKWLQKYPDGVEHEHTPNARTQKIAHDDAAARAQAQREQFQAEERARQDAREQQRIAAEEAAKWKRQRENGQDTLDNSSDLNVLIDQYEKWLQEYADGVEHEHAPNAQTQRIVHDDTAARAQARREQFQSHPGHIPFSAPIQSYGQHDSSTSHIRPPPLPATVGIPQSAQPIQTEAGRIPKPPDAIFDPNIPLKTVTLARECLPRFLAIAKVNTEMNKETCGLLLGRDKGHKYSVTTLLIPKQHSTSDTCTMDEEELVLQFTEERSLITLGWVSHSLFYLY